MMKGYTAGQLRKTLVAVASFLLVVISLALAQGDLIPDALMKWAIFVIAVGNAYGVFRVPNDPT